jgi:hypothetical protein
MRPLLLLLLLSILLLPQPVLADEAADLLIDNQLLTAELQLARSGKLYIVFDLRDYLIRFKASGVNLITLPLKTGKLYGPAPEAKTHSLTERKTASPPRREAVRIPDKTVDSTAASGQEDGDDTLQALERSDMPGNYRLILEDGTRINVRSDGSGFVAAVGRIGRSIGDSTARGGRAIWQLFSTPTTELQLALSLDDAQQLYWSFAEEAPCLIRPPATTLEH